MKTITYDETDILPLTIFVLNLCVHNYTCNAYKLVIDREYPDLKGVVLTDILDENAIDLLDDVRTDWFEVVTVSIAAVNKTLKSLAKIHELDVQAIVDDNRIYDLAIDFYDGIIVDNFVSDGEEAPENDDLADTLRSYAFSIIDLLSCLYYLTMYRCYRQTLTWRQGWAPCHFLGEMHQENEYRITLDLLQALGQQLEEDYFNLAEIKF
jgi:hypothetical protein